jgi:hypothetical protein
LQAAAATLLLLLLPHSALLLLLLLLLRRLLLLLLCRSGRRCRCLPVQQQAGAGQGCARLSSCRPAPTDPRASRLCRAVDVGQQDALPECS